MHRRKGTTEHRRLQLFYHFSNMQVTYRIQRHSTTQISLWRCLHWR